MSVPLLLLTALGLLWQLECSGQTTVDIQLRAHGAAKDSPLTQSLIGAEAISEAVRTNQPVMAALQKKLETERKKDAPFPATESSEAISSLTKNLDAADQLYSAQIKGIESAKKVNEAIPGFIELITGGKATELALKIGGAGLQMTASERLEALSKVSEIAYRNNVQNALDLAVIEADHDTALYWADRGVTDENVEEARVALFGPAAQLFEVDSFKNLDSTAKAELASTKANYLATALTKLKSENDVDLKKTKAELKKNISENSDTINKTLNDVSQLKQQLKINADAVSQLAQYTAEQTTKFGAELSNINSQIEGMQSVMWRSMSPAEQVQALDSGFLPSLKDPHRSEIREEAFRTAKALKTRDDSLAALSTIGELGKLAAALGAPVDVYNLNRNIQTATSAVNVAASLATGNYIGALQNMSGLFGDGGGPDASAIRHQQIMNELAKIEQLQIRTLQRLDDLSRQITLSTQILMKALGKIDANLGVVLQVSKADELSGHGACDQFVWVSATYYGMKGGLFPSYEKRVEQFSNDQKGNQLFQRCRSYLDEVRRVDAQDGGPIGDVQYNMYKPALLASLQESVPANDPRSYQFLYSELWLMHQIGLYLGASEACYNRLGAILAAAPQRFDSVAFSDFSCQDAKETDFQNIKQALYQGSGRLISSKDALSHPLAPAAVRQATEFSLFIGPYLELITETTQREGRSSYRLRTKEELVEGKKLPPPEWTGELREWSLGFMDVLNLAIAQQGIVSGYALTKIFADSVVEGRFGNDARIWTDIAGKDFVPVTDNVKDPCWTDPSAALEALQIYRYRVAVCFILKSDSISQNVVTYLVLKDLAASAAAGISPSTYQLAVQSADKTYISQLLPTLAPYLVWSPSDSHVKWAVQLKGRNQANVELLLPTASEVLAGRLARTPSEQLMTRLRERLRERLVLTSGAAHDELADNQRGYYFRQALLTDQSYTTVEFTVPLREPVACWENPLAKECAIH